MLPTSECAEQRTLWDTYNAAPFLLGVTALEGASMYREFAEFYGYAEGMGLLFVRARLDLDEHIREHGCLVTAQNQRRVRFRFFPSGDNFADGRAGNIAAEAQSSVRVEG